MPYHAPGQSRARERGSSLRCAMFCSRRTRRPSAEVCSCIRPGADKEEGSVGRKDNKLGASTRAGGGKHRRVRARETAHPYRRNAYGVRWHNSGSVTGIILGPSLDPALDQAHVVQQVRLHNISVAPPSLRGPETKQSSVMERRLSRRARIYEPEYRQS